LTLYLGYHAKTSFIVSLGLIEVGEFAFVLARVGLSETVITSDVYGMILSVALLSILIMPPLFLAAPVLYLRLKNYSKTKLPPLYTRFFARYEHHDLLEELPYKDHVVLCGYGRVGKYVGRALDMAGIPYVVVEYNQQKARELKDKGIKVVYGDPADIDILDYAQVDKARAVVVAIPDLHTQRMVVENSLHLNKDVKIYCRTHHEEHQAILKDLGVTSIIQPEFEASLSVTDKILSLFGKKPKDISGKITRLKIEHGLG
jgi:CPA2 family monovalent cation:H+ antiporter-2